MTVSKKAVGINMNEKEIQNASFNNGPTKKKVLQHRNAKPGLFLANVYNSFRTFCVTLFLYPKIET